MHFAHTAEIALSRHGKYDLTKNNCQHYARVLLSEFVIGRQGRANAFHADDRRLQNGAVDYNTAGLGATYERGYDNCAQCFCDPYRQEGKLIDCQWLALADEVAAKRRRDAAMHAEPNESRKYVKHDVEVLVDSGGHRVSPELFGAMLAPRKTDEEARNWAQIKI